MEIVTRERFATSDQEVHELPQGLTIDEMMTAVGWKPELRPWTYVTVNGQEVSSEIWHAARPKEGRRVLIALRPAGGGGGSGKQIGLAVAAIAISVVAIFAAPIIVGAIAGVATSAVTSAAVGSTLFIANAVVTAGLAIAGNLALGALVRPGTLGKQTLSNSGSGGNAASESNTYGINGASNTLSRYGVVPRVYGRHRMTPPFAAEPYVVSAGTAQTINLLLDFGYGPLLVEDIRIGNTPISNFPTARWHVHSEYKKGDPLYIYQNDQATLEVGAVLTELVDNVRVSPQAGSLITLEFAFPGGLTGITDQGASYQKDDHVTVFAMPESGAGGWQPISNFTPWALFQGEGGTQGSGESQVGTIAVYRWSRGTNPDFPQGFVTGDPVAQQMVPGSLFTYNGVGYSINAVEPNPVESGNWNVKLANLPPDIDWIYTHTGIIRGEEGRAGTFPLQGSSGALGPLWVTFGPSAYDVEFHGQTRTPRVVSVQMLMPYEDKWQILVRRSTPVSNSPLISNQITWSTLRASRWVLPIAPEQPRTILELQITASEQISGQVQNINALCTSILWDDRVRARVPTRNPAWIYADILTGTANPRPVSWSRLDLDKIKEWADKNDALTVQGDQFATCDLVVDYRLTVGELCQNVCSTGRGAPTVVDGLYSVLLDDEDKIPVQMFTNRNADGFRATRAWVDFPHALKVQYMSENTWNREELIVYFDGYNELNATKFETLQLAGIVRPNQVWRFGRYYMAAAYLRRERLSLTADVENLVCQRGDLVRVAHDRLFQNFSARVRRVAGASLEMDAYLNTELFSSVFTTPEADVGAQTSWPPGWSFAGNGNAAVTLAVLGKGRDAGGRSYLDVQITKAAAGGSTNWVQIFPTPFIPGPNSDDLIATEWEIEPLSIVNFTGDYLQFNTQPTGSTGGTGLGSPNVQASWPAAGERRAYTDLRAPGNSLGVTVGWRPNVQFFWEDTVDHPATMVLRIYTPRFWINNPKPSLLARVDAVRPRYITNPEASGASVGIATGSGSNVFPTDWISQQWAGWTREVTGVRQVQDYWEIDLRVTAPAGTAGMSLVYAFNQLLPLSKQIFTRVQVQRFNVVGTAPTVQIRHTALTSEGVFISNQFSPVLTPNATHPIEITHGPTNYNATANAERFSSALWIVPAAGAAADATFRIRLPMIGDTTNPTAGLPAEPVPESIYGQLRTVDGTLVDSFPILARPAEDQVLVSADIAVQATPGDLISIGTLDTETSDWIVDKITAGGDFAANLELIEYAPEVLQADKGPIPPYVPNDGSGIIQDLPPVRNLNLISTLFLYTPDGVPTHENLLTWDPPAFQVEQYIVYRLYVVSNPGEGVPPPFLSENVLIEIGRVNSPRFLDTLDTRTLRQGGTLVRYTVVPVSMSGRRGSETSVEGTFLPDTTAPPKLLFTTNVLSETTMLIWNRPEIPDLGGYQIRFVDKVTGKTNPEWEDMVSVVDSVSPNLTSLTVHIQTGIYAIRAYDTSGNFGPPSFSATQVDILPDVDEVTRLIEGPVWNGQYDGTELFNGELRLKKNPDGTYPREGWFYPTSAVSYPSSWLFRVRGAFDSYVVPDGQDVRGDWNVQIWVAIQKAAPTLDDPWFDPLINADPLAGGPGVYVPLGTVAQTDMTGRLINWAIRLVSRRPTLTPLVRKAFLIVDHSERREFQNDVATGTGGKNFPFKFAFFNIPTVAVTLNNGQVGDRIVKSASTTALTVEVFNNAGVSVDRKIDWQAIGYGRG